MTDFVSKTGPWVDFRNAPLGVKLPSDALVTVIELPSVVDTRAATSCHQIGNRRANLQHGGPALWVATIDPTASPDPRPGSGTSGGRSWLASPRKMSPPLVPRRRRPPCSNGAWCHRFTCDAKPSPACAPE